jgi:hypothetical protein
MSKTSLVNCKEIILFTKILLNLDDKIYELMPSYARTLPNIVRA